MNLLQIFLRSSENHVESFKPLFKALGRECHVDSEFDRRFPELNTLIPMELAHEQGLGQSLEWVTSEEADVKELVTHLIIFNESMRNYLDQKQLEELDVMQTRTELQIMQRNSSIGELNHIFHSALLSSGENDLSNRSQRLAVLSWVKVMSIVSNNLDLSASESEDYMAFKRLSTISSLKLQRPNTFECGDTNQRYLIEPYCCFFDSGGNTPAWTEWMTYETGFDPLIAGRVEALKSFTAFLTENNYINQFPIVLCLGYRHEIINLDKRRVGVVFKKPGEVDTSARPISLHTLINGGVEAPSLPNRIMLMRRLAEIIMLLITVDWTPINLCLANILFFSLQPEGIGYDSPYISGFGCLRKAEVSTFDAPNLFGARTLGIILLEIAFWKPIGSIPFIVPQSTGEDGFIKLREKLWVKPDVFQPLKSSSGDIVGEAVRSCLEDLSVFRGQKGEDKITVEANFLCNFYEKLVRNLKSVKL